MLVIKNYIIDSDKIHAQIQENKKKEPKKQGKFQRKLQEVMEQAEAQAKDKRNSNCCFIKKSSNLGAFFFVLVNHDFDIYYFTQFNYVVPIIMLS
jgi:hypothetical protein